MLNRIFLTVFLVGSVFGVVKQYNYLRTPDQLKYSILANLRYDTCSAGTVMQYVINDQVLYTYYFASDSVSESAATPTLAHNDENKTASVSESVLSGIAGGTMGANLLNTPGDKNTPGDNSVTKVTAGVGEILSGYFLGLQIANFTRPGAKSKTVRAILADKKNWPDMHRQYVRGLINYTYLVAEDIKDAARRNMLTRRLTELTGNDKVLLGYLDYTIVRDRLHVTALAAGQTEEKAFRKAKTIDMVLTVCGTVASLAILAWAIYRQKKGQKANNKAAETLVTAEAHLQ